ncbi:MAG: DnaT-like ssDNA-binding domain-containing protein [Pseudomonadota bacterium]
MIDRTPMAAGKLIPDPQLVFSAELATAVGLEEAVLLQQIKGLYLHQPATRRDERDWIHVSKAYLLQLMPFWRVDDLDRLCQSLESIGLISLDRAGAAKDCLLLAINDSPGASSVLPAGKPPSLPGSAAQKAPPSETTLNEPQAPATATVRDRSGTAPFPKSGQGQPLPMDFLPSEDMLEILEQFHGIPRSFALQQVEDFTLYWRERGSAGYAWQNKFKQHVQFRWAKHQQEPNQQVTTRVATDGGERGFGSAGKTRDRSLKQDLTDRSWAD